VGDTSWGTHICVFYETKQDLLDCRFLFRGRAAQQRILRVGISDPIAEREAMKR
jgi:hypothetical protein